MLYARVGEKLSRRQLGPSPELRAQAPSGKVAQGPLVGGDRMSDDYSKYETMKHSGSSPEDVYREASRDGIDPIGRIRLIAAVYSLSPGQAKEVVVRAEGEAESLDRHQDQIAEDLLSQGTTRPAS